MEKGMGLHFLCHLSSYAKHTAFDLDTLPFWAAGRDRPSDAIVTSGLIATTRAKMSCANIVTLGLGHIR